MIHLCLHVSSGLNHSLFTLRKARSPMESELFLEWTDYSAVGHCYSRSAILHQHIFLGMVYPSLGEKWYAVCISSGLYYNHSIFCTVFQQCYMWYEPGPFLPTNYSYKSWIGPAAPLPPVSVFPQGIPEEVVIALASKYFLSSCRLHNHMHRNVNNSWSLLALQL